MLYEEGCIIENKKAYKLQVPCPCRKKSRQYSPIYRSPYLVYAVFKKKKTSQKEKRKKKGELSITTPY